MINNKDYFIKNTKTRNNKYLKWQLDLLKTYPRETLVDIANLFDKYKHKLDQKDIYQYKIQHINSLYESLKHFDLKKENKIKQKAEANRGAEILYSSPNFILRHIKTTEAAILYGKNTKWCISASKSDNMFDEYVSNLIGIFFLEHIKDNEKTALLFENYFNIELYDSKNNQNDFNIMNIYNYFKNKYESEINSIINICENKISSLFNFNFEDDYSFEKIKNEPYLIIKYLDLNKSFTEEEITQLLITQNVAASLFNDPNLSLNSFNYIKNKINIDKLLNIIENNDDSDNTDNLEKMFRAYFKSTYFDIHDFCKNKNYLPYIFWFTAPLNCEIFNKCNHPISYIIQFNYSLKEDLINYAWSLLKNNDYTYRHFINQINCPKHILEELLNKENLDYYLKNLISNKLNKINENNT